MDLVRWGTGTGTAYGRRIALLTPSLVLPIPSVRNRNHGILLSKVLTALPYVSCIKVIQSKADAIFC